MAAGDNMSFPRFIIAKYVPELKRMEPRNIGVFLWAAGTMSARFLDPTPSFVNEANTYRRWVEFWTRQVTSGEIQPKRGNAIGHSDPSCLQALLDTQKGEYMLVDAGELADSVRKRDINSALEFLFNDLVALPERSTKPSSHDMETRCADIFKRAGLDATPEPRELKCPVYGVKKRMRFHYALASRGDKLAALFHRVNISHDPSVFNVALMASSVSSAALLRKQRCGLFYHGSAVDSASKKENLELLSEVGHPIDIDDLKAAGSEVAAMI